MAQQKRALADMAVNQARGLEVAKADSKEFVKNTVPAQELPICNQINSGQIRILCKKEIRLLLNLDIPSVVGNKCSGMPKSGNELQTRHTSNFNIVNDQIKSVSRIGTIEEADMKRLGKSIRCLAVCGKENRSSNGSSSGTSGRGRVQKNPKAKVALSTRAKEIVKTEILVPEPRPHVLRRLSVVIVSAASVLRRKRVPPSPIQPNPGADINTIIFGKLRKAKLFIRNLKPEDPVPRANDDYTEEFLADIIKNCKEQDTKIVLSKEFLKKFNPDSSQRVTVVSWMLEVQHLFTLSDSEFYLSINLLDQVLSRLAVPKNMCQLVALSCIWISNKFLGRNTFCVRLLLHISGNTYNRPQLVKMEKKILKLLNFKVHSVEPSIYVNAYMKAINIDSTPKSHFSMHFVLDCAVHLEQYSEMLPSVVAAAAMTVAFQLFHRENVDKIKNYFNQNMSAEVIETCKALQVAIVSQIGLLREREPWSLIILNKYKDCSWLKLPICICRSCFDVNA